VVILNLSIAFIHFMKALTTDWDRTIRSCIGGRLCCCFSRYPGRTQGGLSGLRLVSSRFVTIISRTIVAGSHRLDAAVVTDISRTVEEATVLAPFGRSPIGIMLTPCSERILPLIAIHTSNVLHPPTAFVSADRTWCIVGRDRTGLRCHWRLCWFVCGSSAGLWARFERRLC